MDQWDGIQAARMSPPEAWYDALLDRLANAHACARQTRFDAASPVPVDRDTLARTLIHAFDVFEHEPRPGGLLARLRHLMETAPAAVLHATPVGYAAGWDPSRFAAILRDAGVRVAFSGWGLGRHALVAICDRAVAPGFEPAPEGFRVLAIVKAYNEADIIVPSLTHLIRQGIDVYLVDNWSDDGTWELTQPFVGHGVVGAERHPHQPQARFNWRGLLERTEEIASTMPADWYVHYDVDEVRRSPWPHLRLKDAIYRVDRSGFNAIDHTVVTFHPVDDGYRAHDDFEAYFRYFDFPRRRGSFVQIKAWKRSAARVSLADSGGHEVGFPGRAVYPIKFLLKHYPVRSQAHGLRKVLRERVARWDPAERAAGWHTHYDDVGPAHRFVRAPETLEYFEPQRFDTTYLIERLSGIGLAPGAAHAAHSDVLP